jgi:hypothetical protein
MTDNIFITNCKIEKFMQFLSKQINFHKLQVFIKKVKTLGSLFVKQIGVAKWNLLMLVFLIF